ncbi:MAG: DUF2269 domain-containing protein [Phyllobacteriaceae bacterium]|nr:DUF2269 domain-containing protein [Phyllobacteriaceae bacterium]
MEEVLRFLHLVGATILLGTGAGIAFFMVMANRTRDPATIAHVAATVVVADLLFTATAVVAQPVTGILLAMQAGWPLTTPWIMLALALYVFTGLCWLPVVWLQMRMRDLARGAAAKGEALPAIYFRFFRIWFALGVLAFAAVLAILWLMLARPGM